MIDHRYPGFADIRLKNSSNFGARSKEEEKELRHYRDILIMLFFGMKIMDIRLWY